MPEEPRVRVERELCLGADYCTKIAPATFSLGDDGIAVVTDDEGDSDGSLTEAERTCPAGAIFLRE